MAQWVAAGIALVLGARAEIRAWRTRHKERTEDGAAAIAQLIAVLRRAEEVLPSQPCPELQVSADGQRQAMKQLAVLSRETIKVTAGPFPDAAAHLFDLADQLEEMAGWSSKFLEAERSRNEILEAHVAAYQALRVLSIPVATRVHLKGDPVTQETFSKDRYCKEFDLRYQQFREERWRILNFPTLLS